MSAGLVGALIGLAVAVVDFLALRLLASRVDLPETKRVLNITGLSQFVLLPVIGYFVAPLFTGD
jgi:uncharacterized membrane protein